MKGWIKEWAISGGWVSGWMDGNPSWCKELLCTVQKDNEKIISIFRRIVIICQVRKLSKGSALT